MQFIFELSIFLSPKSLFFISYSNIFAFGTKRDAQSIVVSLSTNFNFTLYYSTVVQSNKINLKFRYRLWKHTLYLHVEFILNTSLMENFSIKKKTTIHIWNIPLLIWYRKYSTNLLSLQLDRKHDTLHQYLYVLLIR